MEAIDATYREYSVTTQPKNKYMQYAQKASDAPIADQSQSEFSRVNEILEKQLAWQGELIHKIDENLHNIKNLREPQKETAGKVPEIKDFVASLDNKISQLNSHNEMLEKISNHLSKIV